MDSIYSYRHEELARKLREARKSAGYTQEEAAEALGVSQNWVSRVEIGDKCVTFLEAEDMALIYSIDLKKLESNSE